MSEPLGESIASQDDSDLPIGTYEKEAFINRIDPAE
jgi:hypothetical protein